MSLYSVSMANGRPYNPWNSAMIPAHDATPWSYPGWSASEFRAAPSGGRKQTSGQPASQAPFPGMQSLPPQESNIQEAIDMSPEEGMSMPGEMDLMRGMPADDMGNDVDMMA